MSFGRLLHEPREERERPAPVESRVLTPLVMECRCGARLRIAKWWTAFKCGKCGRVADEHGVIV